MSCNKEKEELSEMKKASKEIVIKTDLEAYNLLKSRCYACHNPNVKFQDQAIAPPMAAVKRRYSMGYNTREEFINAIARWAINPDIKRALMRGAVDQFKVMPKQQFKEDELLKIGAYIYDNEIEIPVWFAEHEKEMHGRGSMGKGGMGRGMMRNK
jgi:hypothetical protein